MLIGIILISSSFLCFAETAQKYVEKAKTAMDQGKFDNVIAYSNKAIELAPENAGAYLYRGLGTMFKKSNFEQCLADFNKAIEINPKFADAYSARGGLYRLFLHKYAKAIRDYNSAIALEPTNTCYLGDRSKAYLDNRNYDEAIADCNRLITLIRPPNNLGAYVLRAEVYVAKGECRKAWDDIRRAQKSGYLVPRNIMDDVKKTCPAANVD